MKDIQNISIKEFNDEFKRKVKEDDDKALKDFNKSIDMEDIKRAFK